jgi:hypothetical protein
MATKKRNRKLARIRTLQERSDVVLPRLQLTLLGDPVALGHVGLVDSVPAFKKIVASFEFPCPCCGKGISGEIVGRL